jgi:hypothetical protein
LPRHALQSSAERDRVAASGENLTIVRFRLRTRWHLMQPTKSFCEGGMLPLFGILEHNDHIK